MRAILLLLALLALANASHWYVWTQNTDPAGEWGFLNFYPKALTVNPGDYVTFIQYHDSGIIVLQNATATSPTQFYTGAGDPCPNNTCVALTQYSLPHTGGVNGSVPEHLTHVDSITNFDYSSGFMAAIDENLSGPPLNVPYTWTFYFDENVLAPGSADVAIQAFEILHVMRMQIIVTLTPVPISEATANQSALTQIALDVAAVPEIYNSTVMPVNNPGFQNNICAWTVHLGAQVSKPNAAGYGLGSFDRYLPWDPVEQKSYIDINQGDSVNFLQLTPHAHSVSIYNLSTPFAPNAPYPDFTFGCLKEPVTHFIPSPFPDPNTGIVTWDGLGHCVVGVMLFPGINITVKFDTSPGTFYSLCIFHEAVNMVGEIRVHPKGTIPYPAGTPKNCKSTFTTSTSSFSATLVPMAALVALLITFLL